MIRFRNAKTCAYGAAVLAATSAFVAHSATPSQAEDAYRKSVLPILRNNCYACHNDQLHTADLSLEAFQDASTAVKQLSVWDKVHDKLLGRADAAAGNARALEG